MEEKPEIEEKFQYFVIQDFFGLMSDLDKAIAMKTTLKIDRKIFVVRSLNSLVHITLKNRFVLDFDGPVLFVESTQP